jgi:amino acid transporter
MPFLTFVVAFAVLASGLASAATIGRAFGGQYLSAFVAWPTVAVGLGFLAVIAAINLRGIRESMRFNFALTLIEVAGLLLVVVIGVTALTDGFGDPSRVLEFDRDTSVFMAILGGAGIAFFALIGFEDSVNLAEEARRPRVDYPWALFGGLMAAGAIYLAVTLVASMVVPVDRLASSSAPLLEVTSVGPLAVPDRLFSAIALFALANGALINLIMASRLMYGMAEQGVVPGVLGRVLPKRGTPWVAIVFTTALAAGLLVTGDLGDLAETTVLLLLAVFAIVNVAVLVLRRDPVDFKHFRSPTAMPVIGFIVSIGLMTTKDGEVFLRAGILIGVGALLWVVTRLIQGHRR